MISACNPWVLALLMSIRPFDETKFTAVFEQQSDLSCGIASASSLASIYWGIEVSEEMLMKLLFSEDEKAEPTAQGVSMYELKIILGRLGFTAGGFELDYSALREATLIYGPLIVHLNVDAGHFVLYVGEIDGFAVLGDPSRGSIAVVVKEFLSSWSRTALAAFHPGGKLDSQAVARAASETGRRLESLLSWCRQ